MLEQLQSAFGLKFHAEPVQGIKGLPLYMLNGRSFYKLEAYGIPFLLVALSENDQFGVVALEKQLVKYSEAAGMNVAYGIPTLTRVQRDALTARSIPFISVPGQLFLPFLGIELQNRFRAEKKAASELMTPASQSLFLYFLYEVKDGSVLKKQAADALGLTRTSITRASAQLSAMGLIAEEAAGKEIHMKAARTGRELLEQATPYLISPVFRKMKVEKCPALSLLPAAGESALSLKTTLNAPSIPVLAVKKDDLVVKKLQTVDDRWEPGHDMVEVELWKYDPLIFAKDRIVDPVSLMMSLRDVQDERVEGELKDYREGIRR